MFNADRYAFERRVLAQAAFLSAATVADLLGPSRAQRVPTPSEVIVPHRTGR